MSAGRLIVAENHQRVFPALGFLAEEVREFAGKRDGLASRLRRHIHGEDAVSKALRSEKLHIFKTGRELEVEGIEESRLGRGDGRLFTDESRGIGNGEDG